MRKQLYSLCSSAPSHIRRPLRSPVTGGRWNLESSSRCPGCTAPGLRFERCPSAGIKDHTPRAPSRVPAGRIHTARSMAGAEKQGGESDCFGHLKRPGDLGCWRGRTASTGPVRGLGLIPKRSGEWLCPVVLGCEWAQTGQCGGGGGFTEGMECQPVHHGRGRSGR